MAKILIVDDEELDRVYERAILETADHELFYAHEGSAARKICEEMSIDLIVTDLAMPAFNGLRLIKELREDGVTVPIIAVSGWASDQLDLAEDYGADLAMVKPLDGEDLLKAVDQVLRGEDRGRWDRESEVRDRESEAGDREDPWKKGRYL